MDRYNMNGQEVPVAVGIVNVATSSHGGHPVEFFAEGIVRQLIYVADSAPQPIRDQAMAYQQQMYEIVLGGLKMAIASDRAYRIKEG